MSYSLLHSFRFFKRGCSRDDLDFSDECPPEALRIPQANLENCIGYGAPLKTRDDMARSPSRLTLHKSTTLPISWVETEESKEEERKASSISSDEDVPKEVSTAKFCGPRLFIHHYFIPGPDNWESAETQSLYWTNRSSLKTGRSSARNGIFGTDTLALASNSCSSTVPPLLDFCYTYYLVSDSFIDNLLQLIEDGSDIHSFPLVQVPTA